MPYTGRERTIVRSFFTVSMQAIKNVIQEFANKNYRLPGIEEFITIVNKYARNPAVAITAEMGRCVTRSRMHANKEYITTFLQQAVSGIIIPSMPPPRRAALPLIRFNGAILADGSARARDTVMEQIGLSVSDASASVNVNGMSASILRNQAGVGTFYHQTVHSSDSNYGCVDDDGIHKITFIYEKDGDGYYLAAIAKHDGTERFPSRRDQVAKYKVQYSLISTLSVTDTLHFR